MSIRCIEVCGTPVSQYSIRCLSAKKATELRMYSKLYSWKPVVGSKGSVVVTVWV